MRTVLLNLLALQSLVRRRGVPKPECIEAIEQLRGRIPHAILERFDRMTAQSRDAVALVHHGVCCECHMRIPVAAYASLVSPEEVVMCEHCGCYLVLAPDEMPTHFKLQTTRAVVAA